MFFATPFRFGVMICRSCPTSDCHPVPSFLSLPLGADEWFVWRRDLFLANVFIFFTVVCTLRASRLEEKEGRLLKLVGGMLMLALAVVMVINPQLMNNIGSSLLVFGAAFLATGLVLLLHRRILPSFGILIGTEMKPRKKTHRPKR